MIYDLALLSAAAIATLTSEVLADVEKLRTIAREAADAMRACGDESKSAPR